MRSFPSTGSASLGGSATYFVQQEETTKAPEKRRVRGGTTLSRRACNCPALCGTIEGEEFFRAWEKRSSHNGGGVERFIGRIFMGGKSSEG